MEMLNASLSNVTSMILQKQKQLYSEKHWKLSAVNRVIRVVVVTKVDKVKWVTQVLMVSMVSLDHQALLVFPT